MPSGKAGASLRDGRVLTVDRFFAGAGQATGNEFVLQDADGRLWALDPDRIGQFDAFPHIDSPGALLAGTTTTTAQPDGIVPFFPQEQVDEIGALLQATSHVL